MYTYDVRTPGEGVTPKEEVRLREFYTVDLYQMRTREERVQKSENLADVLCACPPSIPRSTMTRSDLRMKVALFWR